MTAMLFATEEEALGGLAIIAGVLAVVIVAWLLFRRPCSSKTIACPRCADAVSCDAAFCPMCGHPMK